MTRNQTALIAMLIMVITAAVAWAQGPGTRARRYDPTTEIKVQGTVDEVQQITGRRSRSGTHLLLKTENQTLNVYLGPSSYIADEQFSFAKGDSIEVLGSKIELNGKPVLLAREVTKEGKTLVLRNADGIPRWARGWRRP